MRAPGAMLAIDVDSQLARLAEITAAWQAPAELVRRLLAGGAARVDIRLGPARLRVSAPDVELAPDVLETVALAVDGGSPSAQRHEALRRLEESGELVWLWVLSAGRRIRVRCRGREPWRAELWPGGARRGPSRAGSAGPAVLDVTVAWPRRPWEARRWLRHAAALAPVPVTLNGRRLSSSWVAPLGGSVGSPLPARLGLGSSGTACRLWLLHDGVLGALATVPGWPGFAAAIELAGRVGPHAPAAALREAVRPHLPRLLEQAVVLAVRSAPLLAAAPAEVTSAVQEVLLAGARLGVRRDEVERAAAFPVACGSTTAWRGLSDLRAAARAGVRVAAPRRDGGRAPEGVVVLDPERWTALGEVLGIRVVPCTVARRGERWRDAVRAAVERLPRGRAGRPVPPHRVEEAEAALLRAVEAHGAWPDGAAVEAVLTAGDGAPRRRGGSLLLPRGDRLVRAARRGLARRPDLAAPLVRALLGPHGVLLARDENSGPAAPVVGSRTATGPRGG